MFVNCVCVLGFCFCNVVFVLFVLFVLFADLFICVFYLFVEIGWDEVPGGSLGLLVGWFKCVFAFV